jgi:hypothetical protein
MTCARLYLSSAESIINQSKHRIRNDKVNFTSSTSNHTRPLARLIGLSGEVSANSAGNMEVSANSEGRLDMGVYELPGSSKTSPEDDGIVEDPDKAADDGE